MKNHLFKISILFLVLILASCAHVESIDTCVNSTHQDSLLAGILHGFIAPITFLISIFKEDVAMYAVNNSGALYDLGFLIGIGGFSGGILKSRKKKNR